MPVLTRIALHRGIHRMGTRYKIGCVVEEWDEGHKRVVEALEPCCYYN